MREVMSSEAGWHWSGQWVIWVCVMAAIVFLLTYRDIRISTTAGVILGAFEIAIFGALAVWMIISNAGDLNLQPFNPHHADGGWNGVFRGMVFAILAFIGFEAAAPLGEEAKHPRHTIPRAVVGSAVAIGLVLHPVRVRLGLRRRLQQLRRPGDRRGPVARARQDVLERRLGARVPRDLQLDRRELECGGERRDAGVLRAGAEPARARAARHDASGVQDAVHRDHLDEHLRGCAARCCSAGNGDRSSGSP